MRLRVLLAGVLLATLCVTVVFGGGQEELAEGEVVELEFWTFQPLHNAFYEGMAEVWNEQNPERPIDLQVTAYPYDDMHDNLLVALQSGVGLPDIVDIEISRFPTYVRGVPQLLPLDDYIADVRDDFVESRLTIFSANDTLYGLPFHVGATVMYYNVDLMEQAGVDIDDIEYWDDYVEAGRQVWDQLGIPITTFELTDQWSFLPMSAQRQVGFISEDGEVNLDHPTLIDTLEFQQQMLEEGIAEIAPGGGHHSEEYYGFMNGEGAASVLMPFWYMGRFLDHMPDLDGKIAIRPLPRFEEGGFRSAGMGGTGTAVPSQGNYPELAAEFLAFAKASEEGNIRIWEELGFDPPRHSVWDDPRLQEENRFTRYFVNGTGIFDTIYPLTDEIYPLTLSEDFPEAVELVRTEVLVQALQDGVSAEQALRAAADQLR